MNPKLVFILLVLAFVHQAQSYCWENVDCDVVDGIDGVFLDHCPPDRPNNHSGHGTGHGGTHRKPVYCCENFTYWGSDPVHYLYNGSCPVYIEFLFLDIDPGEKLIIRNIYCDDHDGCHRYIIHPNAVAPFTLPVSGALFTFNAIGDIHVIFRIVNWECPPPCRNECPPMWYPHNESCYYVNYRFRNWDFHKEWCHYYLDAVLAPLLQVWTWHFVYDLAGPLTWVGLHCIDDNNTEWYYLTADHGLVENPIPGVWEPGYPVAGVNRHCAGFPAAGGGGLTNSNCEAQNKGVCCRAKSTFPWPP